MNPQNANVATMGEAAENDALLPESLDQSLV